MVRLPRHDTPLEFSGRASVRGYPPPPRPAPLNCLRAIAASWVSRIVIMMNDGDDFSGLLF